MHCVMLTGTVPKTWAQPGAFPNLSVLVFKDVPLTGTLPPCWGSNGSFPVLDTLQLGSDSPSATPFSGTLPPEWGSATHWQNLTVLLLTNCSITGDLSFWYDGAELHGGSLSLSVIDIDVGLVKQHHTSSLHRVLFVLEFQSL